MRSFQIRLPNRGVVGDQERVPREREVDGVADRDQVQRHAVGVEDLNAGERRDVDVPGGIGLQPVRVAGLNLGEYALVLQEAPVDNVERLDMARRAAVAYVQD